MIFTRRWKRLVVLGIALALLINPFLTHLIPSRSAPCSSPRAPWAATASTPGRPSIWPWRRSTPPAELGRPLEAMVEDTQLKKEVVLELAKRFIEQDKVDFLMGPTSSGLAMALSEVARDNKKILVLTQAAADALTGAKFHPYVFSTLSNAMMHSRSGAYMMAAKPYKRYMVVAPDYNYGHASWKMFKEKLVELRPDVEIVGELFPKFLAEDYTETINQVLGPSRKRSGAPCGAATR